MTKGRIFAARYKPGVLFVSGPVLAVAMAVGLAAYLVLSSITGALAAAALCGVLATLALSARKRARPALLLSDAGVEIDGLSLVEWSRLERVRILPPFHETQSPGMEISFAVNASAQGLRATGPSPLWRPLSRGIFLRLALLEDTPDAIADAFNFFLRQSGATAKPS